MDGFCYSYCYFCCSSSSSYQHTIEYNFQIESALRHHLHSASCLCISENLTNFQCASFHAFALSLGLFSHHGKYAVLLTFDCAFCNTAFIYYLFILFVFAANFRPLFFRTRVNRMCEQTTTSNMHSLKDSTLIYYCYLLFSMSLVLLYIFECEIADAEFASTQFFGSHIPTLITNCSNQYELPKFCRINCNISILWKTCYLILHRSKRMNHLSHDFEQELSFCVFHTFCCSSDIYYVLPKNGQLLHRMRPKSREK